MSARLRTMLLAGVAAAALGGGLPDARGPVDPAPPDARGPVDPAPPDARGPVDPAPPDAPAAPAPAREGVDPSARLPEGDQAAEHWDLVARFDTGHHVVLRVLITNAGPGERTAVASGHVIAPDGRVTPFQNGRREGRWELSPDRRRIRIGSSVLAFPEDRRVFEVDNDKRDIEVRLELAADGSDVALAPGPRGYRIDLLNLATPVRGTLELPGMRAPRTLSGRAALTHTWFPGPEDAHVAERRDWFTLAPGPRLFVSEVLPAAGDPWHRAAAGGREGIGTRSVTLVRGETREDAPLPRTLEVRGKDLEATFSLGERWLAVDPLDALPALLRMVYSFGGRPRHLWIGTAADGALKSPRRDAVLRFEGAGVVALYDLDSTPPR